jgi:hypothetical protein
VYVTNQFVLGTLTGLPALGVGGAILAAFAALVYAQVWRYRHYLTPLQRQQVKWFLFGVAIVPFAFLPWVILGPTWTSPDLADPNHIPTLSFLLVWTLWLMALPISVGIAILRYRLWDIDLIIRRTVTYALVTAFLLVVFFGSVVVLQQLFAAFTGDVSSRILSGIGIVRDDTSSGGNELITVISTLAIAALFVPVRNRIQDVIDRRFNRKKYDAQQVLQNFGETVRDETDLERLTSELVNVVQETMQPKSVSLWLKREE